MQTQTPTTDTPFELLDIIASRAVCGGLSRNHFYQLIREGVLPKPVKLSIQCSRWIKAELLDALRKQAAKRTPAKTPAQNG